MSIDVVEECRTQIIEQAMQVGALKFGQFTLKSGRVSPYFFNAGLLSTGPLLATVAKAYAATIMAAQNVSPPFPAFDVLFGPPYKAIPLAACTALVLATTHALPVGFAYHRKELKDHGEGGSLVGAPVRGKRVVVLDDVMTSGTAVRDAMDRIKKEGGIVVGVMQLLDREEVGLDGKGSTVREIEELIGGKGTVRSILRMRDLSKWLEHKGKMEELALMKSYWERYGIEQQ